MKRRKVVTLAAAVALVCLALLAAQKKKAGLLLLDWSGKAKAETPPLALLLEMGLKDPKPRDWSGKASAEGAKVVRREGYRFRPGDELIGDDGWKASSHWGLRVPERNIALRTLEPRATVGVVFHLGDVKADAKLTFELADATLGKKETVAVKDVLAGKPLPLWKGQAALRRVSAATPVAAGKTEDDHPAAAYGPDGTLWVAYISYTLKDESRRVEQGQFPKQPDNFKALYTPEFGDQLFVQYYRNGKWSRPAAVTGPKEDLVRCAVAAEGSGKAWVVYSANRKGNYDLYARSLDLNTPQAVSHPRPRMGKEQRLTDNPGPDLSPVMCTDQAGAVQLAFQSWDEAGLARVGVLTCREGKWTRPSYLPGQRKGENRWYAAIAAGPDGQVAVAFDSYRDGDYDVLVGVRPAKAEEFSMQAVAASARFEARPALAYDSKGRLWIAYEEGPENWGKDFGALDANDGKPLYNERSVRVVCLEGDKLKRPAAELPTSVNPPPTIPYDARVGNRYEKAPRYAYPKVGIDGKGRVWLTYREKFGTRYTTHPGSYWLTFARCLDGDKWSEPIEVHHSDGLLDHRPVLLPHNSGSLLVIHNTDGRYTTPEEIGNHIYAGIVDLPGKPVEPKLVAHTPGKKDPKRGKMERAAVERMRTYRVEAGGKKYRFLRGEFHRHTEISWDGGPDGSLEDMFRYAIDCAAMDWIGNGDHDSGAGREYSWWLIQKFSDAYHVPKAFTPMFTYERSVSYPHGHRNPVFAQRGVRTLPRLAQPDRTKRVANIHADDTKMLYRYLKEFKGVCAVHTSATGMGTDWRDNDPEVEPFVEIYQGDRMSYEKEGAPRAGYDPKTKKEPANIAGWYPKGYVDRALKKGFRLGFESSSDHWSTHISYCVILAERPGRQGILNAMRKRHTYGATDDIVVDVRSGTHIMGDEFKTGQAPALDIKVTGTRKLARIDILKDSDVVKTVRPGKQSYEGTWTDPKPAEGVHYYYVRVLQEDGELAWASPLWVDYQK
jgi:hypothetical protein